MKMLLCPRCGSKDLSALPDDYYKCSNCGYVGNLTGKGITKS